jgi:septum site-determining protein MinC
MRSVSVPPTSFDDDPAGGAGGDAAHDLFITETMAELSARQGRKGDAAAIYRRLLSQGATGDKRALWQARLAALEAPGAPVPAAVPVVAGVAVVAIPAGAGLRQAPARIPAAPPSEGTVAMAAMAPPRAALSTPAPPADAAPSWRMPLLVRTAVRSGQVIYAEGRDLIVLGPINPGAQLLADGHIHIYATLRGRAVAGVKGATDAQIFCHRLEAELVGIDAAYLAADDLPAELIGKAVRIWLDAGVCRLAPL